MQYNFDEMIERKNTDSLKYDSAVKRGMPEDVLPLWVADMDFKAPDCVIDELINKSRHGIFGYSETGADYAGILKKWFSDRFGWEIQPDWLIETPGVVFAICAAVRAVTEEGESVLIQPPVYHPFAQAVLSNGRRLITNQLAYDGERYSVDFEDFEKKIISEKVKLFILCSPHNPVGRVWTREELVLMGDICLKHGVIVVSDEIHADFIYTEFTHHVFASLKPEFNEITVTCTSPTKTFNLAGLQISNNFIADRELRRNIRREIAKTGYGELNIMGIVACKAAYKKGGEWLCELVKYLSANLGFVRDFLKRKLPRIKLVEPEGTYLLWLDCRGLGLDDKRLNDLFVNKAGLWLNAGTMFGAGGEGFLRINIGCPLSVLEKAFLRLEKAILD